MSFMNAALPLGSAVLSFVFAGMVLNQWRQRHHGFQLVWGVGLLFYGVSTGAEFLGEAFGWSGAVYRVWYLFGAYLVPSYLGAGTVYLLNKTRFGFFVAASVVLGGLFSILATVKYPGSTTAGYVAFGCAVVVAVAISLATATRRELQGHVAMASLVLGTLIVASLVAAARLSGAFVDPTSHVPVATAIPGYLRVSSVPFNAGGGIALVFGALYSAYIYMPKKRVMAARVPVIRTAVNFLASLPTAFNALVAGRLNSRVPATILIAVGALIPGVTSSLNRFGITWSTYLGEFLGVVLVFAGFLVSEEVFRTVRVFGAWSRRSPAPESEIG